MNKTFQIILIVSILTIALSIFYHLVITPVMSDRLLEGCLQEAEEVKVFMQSEGQGSLESFKIYSDSKDNCYRKFRN